MDLPHDWSVEGPPDENAPGAGRVGYFPTGIGWYRKSFRVPASARNRQVRIDFDGVYMNSDVWINGHHLGTRPYGYIGFSYDLTPYLRPGENVIAVRVDNSRQPNSRYYSGSGITRHSWLTIIDPLHIGRGGTFVTTPRVDSAVATVAVRTRVENDRASAGRGSVRSVVIDASGREVARIETAFSLAAHEDTIVAQEIEVTAPRLWSVAAPAMYTLR